MAGGTDLMVQRKVESGLLPDFREDVLFIGGLKELNYIKKEDGVIRIGANMTLENLKNWPDTPSILKEALSSMASPAIRHMATIGGNLGNASPAGDTLPPLYLLNAKVILESKDGRRQLPIEEFILGPGKTAIKKTELIKEIIVEEISSDVTFYKKVGGRKADAISKVSFSAMVSVDDDRIKDFRMAFGAVAPAVVRLKMIENHVNGLTREQLKKHNSWIKDQYALSITPIDDQRSTASYRKACALNLLSYFIGQCV